MHGVIRYALGEESVAAIRAWCETHRNRPWMLEAAAGHVSLGFQLGN